MPQKPKPFSEFVLRTPAFDVGCYLDLVADFSESKLLAIFCTNNYLQQALQMASPELLVGLQKWAANPLEIAVAKKQALCITLLKYMARLCTRCTPFGLFAGCAVGSLGTKTNIELAKKEHFSRYTQFDMHFWVALLQEFCNCKAVRESLTYTTNTSVYSLDDFYRFVTYKYVKTNREHSITALRKTALLQQLYKNAQKGMTIKQLVALIASDDSEHDEAEAYIHELIDYQFLVSNLDAVVTGNDEWQRVFDIVSEIPALANDYKTLLNIQKQFEILDQNVLPDVQVYENIKKHIAKMGMETNEKFLFQTDLNLTTHSNTLNKNVAERLLQTLTFLNGMRQKVPNHNLEHFKKAFLNRYETQTMPLTTVLDTETGIGYVQNTSMNDVHDVLDGFSFKKNTFATTEQTWTNTDFVLEKKLQQALFNNEKTIALLEKDFPEFDANWEAVPATFGVIVEIFKTNDIEQIAIESAGSISATKLLGRFCNGNQGIHDFTKTIVEAEKNHHHDKILAEIVHIPEARTGNILRRPVLRDYEIAYLCNPGMATKNNLPLTDLMVRVQNNKVLLWSKFHNKEVLPCLSNAHNYSSNALPIYHFLSDLQAQNLKPVYGFDWGVIANHYNFFPRVMHKNVILSKARWMVNKNELAGFYKKTAANLFAAFTTWRNHRNINRFVNLVHYDNTLLLDFEAAICVEMFLKSVASNDTIILEEFLFVDNHIVKNESQEGFANQFIISFKTQK